MAVKKPSLWQRFTGRFSDSIMASAAPAADVSGRSSQITCYICYSRADGLHYAKALTDSLAAYGVHVLFDSVQISAGERWADVIQNDLQSADALILIGTPTALQSDYVRSELQFFYRRRNPTILPIMFHGVTASNDIPSILQGIHWLQEVVVRVGGVEIVGRFIVAIDGDGTVVPRLCGCCGHCVTPRASGLVR